MVILNKNPLAMKPKDLFKLRVESLILEGTPCLGGQSG